MNGRLEAEQMAAEHEARNRQRWIPVAERLPDYSDTVWAFDGTDVVLCEHWIGSGFQSLGSSCDYEGLNSETLYGITHWMDVEEPAPPEVK